MTVFNQTYERLYLAAFTGLVAAHGTAERIDYGQIARDADDAATAAILHLKRTDSDLLKEGTEGTLERRVKDIEDYLAPLKGLADRT